VSAAPAVSQRYAMAADVHEHIARRLLAEAATPGLDVVV
jgi:hypothetical protein